DVDNVGLRGEVVSVARGYARNFLLPRRLAEIATPAKVAELEKREAQRARHEARSVEQGREIAELLSKTVLRFDVKAGPTGALFGSVTPTDIADELWRTRPSWSKTAPNSPQARRGLWRLQRIPRSERLFRPRIQSGNPRTWVPSSLQMG